MKIYYNFLLFLFLFGCASEKIAEDRVELGAGVKISTRAFLSIIPENSKIVQLVSYKRENEIKTAQIIFNKKDKLKVSVLSPLGIELLSLSVIKNRLEKLGGVPSFKLDFFYRVMADMLAVYAPKQLFYRETIGDIQVEDLPFARTIRSKGKNLISISYDKKNKWLSNIKYIHHQQKYELEIKTLAIDYEGLH